MKRLRWKKNDLSVPHPTVRDGVHPMSRIVSLAVDCSDRPLHAAPGIDGVWARLTVPAHAIQNLIRDVR
jgi:hypothetical protein